MQALGSYVANAGESPFWDEVGQRLLWVDIRDHRILLTQWPSGETRILPVRAFPSFVAPLASGGLLVAPSDGLYKLDPASGACELIVRAPEGASDFWGMRFNDGVLDPHGRLLIGTLSLDRVNQPLNGALYAIGPDLRWRVLISGLGVINGLAFSPCGTWLYVADSHPSRRIVWRYAYDQVGPSLGLAEVFADFAELGLAGVPDGAAVDAEGGYWIAAHGAGRLLRLSQPGKIDRHIDVPFASVSKPVFAGPDRSFLVTTSFGAQKRRPGVDFAGRLTCLQASVRGAVVTATARLGTL